MQRRLLLPALLSVAGLAFSLAAGAAQPVTLRVLAHSSFDLPKEQLAQFEKDSGIQLQIVKAGDAGEMTNKLILTRARPIADVVYGIDNTMLPRALAAGVIEPYSGPSSQRMSTATLEAAAVPVDYGYVNLNIDKAWFAKSGLKLPTSLEELTRPEYAKLLVVQNPATSSPGMAFLQATIGGLGEEQAFRWWGAMRANGVKVVKGWTEAYYTEFTRNGGTRPIVVSYATSPAAEVFYSKEKISESPTANLFLKGSVFRQVEGVALVKGGRPAAREAAGRFIEFLRSPAVQQSLQTTMWMYPAVVGAERVDLIKQHAAEPSTYDTPASQQAAAKVKAWLQRWTKVVLK